MGLSLWPFLTRISMTCRHLQMLIIVQGFGTKFKSLRSVILEQRTYTVCILSSPPASIIRTSLLQENRSPNKYCKDRLKGLGASVISSFSSVLY